MSQDHYKTLGVSEQASQDEIKRAYKKLAKTSTCPLKIVHGYVCIPIILQLKPWIEGRECSNREKHNPR